MHNRYGIPDVELQRPGGVTVNPADFAGHQLVVLFCPADREAAALDVADYALHMKDLCDTDAWIIGICDEKEPRCGHGASSFTMARDSERLAWDAFQNLLGPRDRTSRDEGAVFLFDRGGGLRRSWAGSGHASDVARAVRQRGFSDK